ncbi:MAG TPA: hypothetical protein EYQ60_13130 [Myxococcales bacterium]|nr:hypothetical protein [Myxococcales bacterium]HIK83666.1 hypothetical protein [Myxococcales bacterium]
MVSSLIGATTYVAMHSVYFLRHRTTTVLLRGALLAFQRYRKNDSRWSLLIGAVAAILIPLPHVQFTKDACGINSHLIKMIRAALRASIIFVR